MIGKMIVCEGLEGSGKSTAISVIKDILLKSNIDCTLTREPGGTPLAEAIREVTKKDWVEKFSSETELMLMYSSRLQLLENVIKPALANGSWVLGDRHDWSSQAYQGGGRGLDRSVIESLRRIVLKGFEPDFVIFLDVDPSEGIARARGRGTLDRFEKQDISFFERTRESFLELCEKNPSKSCVIDANQTIEMVHKEITGAVDSFISSQK